MADSQTQAETCTVKVADIIEYPTELGSRCRLLQTLGLDAYWNTEEELLSALTQSAKSTKNLEICKKQSRCQAFWDKYRQGITPFPDRDPIRLVEFGGRYWVQEGKHRVCMAKRSGVETIEAQVWKMKQDMYSLLQKEGAPGRYLFQSRYKRGRYSGEAAVLWVSNPRGNMPSCFDLRPVVLDAGQSTNGEMVELFPGVSYRVSCRKSGFFRRYEDVDAEVLIAPDHCNTRIWLLKGDASGLFQSRPAFLQSLDTVYRSGCWRKHHLAMSTSCL